MLDSLNPLKQLENIIITLRALIEILKSRGFISEVTADALLDSIPLKEPKKPRKKKKE